MLFSIENSENLSRKERERLFKRREIITAALYLFAEKGFRDTTLDDIAEKSEFGKGTLYNYFANKEEIFLALVQELSKRFLKDLEEIYTDQISVREFLTKLTRRFFQLYAEQSHIFLLMYRVRADFDAIVKNEAVSNMKYYHTESNEYYHKVIARGIKNGEIKEVDPDSLLIFYRSVLFPFIHGLKIYKKGEFDPEKETEFIIDLIFNGISK